MMAGTPINELTNKAVLGLGAVIGTGIMAIMAFGVRAYVDSIYVQKIEALDEKIEYLDRRAFEFDEVFMMVDGLDPITTRRLGADKAWYENQKTIQLRKRADLER